MKMSRTPLVSPATRFEAELSKAILVPSGERTGLTDCPLPWMPSALVEARVVTPVTRSLTKMSSVPLVSPATRLVALAKNASFVPSPENESGPPESPLPRTPAVLVETRVTAPELRSLIKTSNMPLTSPDTRFDAPL